MADNDYSVALLEELREVLKELTASNKSGSERDALRRNLLGLEGRIQGENIPVAALVTANDLAGIRDYGSSWIAARMLKDFAVRDERCAEISFIALSCFFRGAQDAGTRYMAADLLAGLALGNKDYAVPAAKSIVSVLPFETDSYAQNSMRNALMLVAKTGEPAATVALEGLSYILEASIESVETARVIRAISSLGAGYPALAGKAAQSLAGFVENRNIGPAMSGVISKEIASLATANPGTVNGAIRTLSDAFEAAAFHEQRANYSVALASIAAEHPVAVLTSFEQALGKNLSDEHNRMALLSVNALVGETPETTEACSKILLARLPRETSPANLRAITAGLFECTRNGVKAATVAEALNGRLADEALTHVDTRKEMLDTLRRIGHERKFTGGVVEFRRR